MKQIIRITENELRNIIAESVRRCINEDMSLTHNGHKYDDYLDDNDFVKRQVSIDDFIEDEYRNNLIDYAKDTVMDFVNDEAVNNFGYKYGQLYGSGYTNVAEHLIDYIEERFKE